MIKQAVTILAVALLVLVMLHPAVLVALFALALAANLGMWGSIALKVFGGGRFSSPTQAHP
jgi:hypothetical protein